MPTAEEVASYLKREHFGAARRTTNAALSAKFGLTDRGSSGRHGIRNSGQLTKLLNEARNAGHPICAHGRGVFYAQFREELQKTIDWHEKTATKLLAAASACKVALPALPLSSARATGE